MQVSSLQIKHDSDSILADSASSLSKLDSSLSGGVSTESGLDELGSVLDQPVPRGLVSNVGDLDDLSKSVSDLSCERKREGWLGLVDTSRAKQGY